MISGDEAGDQVVESPDVKVSVGKAKAESAPTWEARKSTGCSESEAWVSPENLFLHRNRRVNGVGGAEAGARVTGVERW